MICSYLRHIDLAAVYRELDSYAIGLTDEPLANIHPAISSQVAILLEMRANSTMAIFYSERSEWEKLSPIHVAAEVSDYIERDIEALADRWGLPPPFRNELPDAEWLEQFQHFAAMAVGVGQADYFELQALLVCLYDCACWIYERKDIDGLMIVLAGVEEVATELAHIEARGYMPIMRAKAAANKRHEETNNQRSLALANWDENGAKYSSKTAFSELNHKQYDVKPVTLLRWITQHQKTQSKHSSLPAE